MKLNFARSAAIENMLKREGVKFTIDPAHPVRKFNLETSEKQNAREKGIDDALVEKYIISLLKGDPFPYVVGVINPEKVTEELLIGGLHTTTSVVDPRCNGETVGAYIIDYVPSKRYLIEAF